MRSLTYYLFNLLIFAGPASILVLRRNTISLRFKSLFTVLLSVSVLFIVWDLWAAGAGHWGFNDEYIFGPYVWTIPLEEMLFFVTVPFAMLFVWEVVKLHVREKVYSGMVAHIFFVLSIAASLYLLVEHWGRGYTRSVALAGIFTSFVLYRYSYFKSRRFWVFSGFHLMLFLASNALLTALPVITYGDGSYIGFRVGTIPIEDFLFSYSLIGLTIWLYNRTNDRSAKD